MVLTIYVDHLSQPARALTMFVRVNKIPAQEIIISLAKGEQKTDEFANINRFQKIPAIVHDDFHLAESVAILRYLSREFKVADHWYPADSQAAAKVDEYMAWQHIGLRMPISRYFLIRIKPERLSPIPPTQEEIAEFKKCMEDSLDNFDRLWLGAASDFLCGNQISLADLLAATELEMTRLAGYDVREGRPKLAAYLDKVKSAIGSHYDDVHSNLYQTAEFFKQTILNK